jgi:3-oxoacyl-[acyl-carrier-protein] synthase II
MSRRVVVTGRELDVQYLMSNNFAFSGINTSIIFKKFSE